MRWLVAALLVFAPGCDDEGASGERAPPAGTASRRDRAQPNELAGTYALTKTARAKVHRWARRFDKKKAVAYVETIHVEPSASTPNLLVALGPTKKGPYALRPAGKNAWFYPLKKGWKVMVTHAPRRGQLRVRVGPVNVTYRRVE